MSVTDAELAFYQSVVANPEGKSVSDLAYAFYIGVLTGQIELGGGISPEQQAALNGKLDSSAVAGLETVGWIRGTFYPEGEAPPAGLQDWSLAIPVPADVTAVVTAQGTGIYQSAGTVSVITLTTLVDIPVGDILAVAFSRTTTSSQTGGTSTVSLSAGAVAGGWHRASAQRASVAEGALMVGKVTTLIPAGTTVTVTTTGTGVNRVMAAAASIHNIVLTTTTPAATSGDDANGNNGGVSVGSNASATSLTPATDGSSAVQPVLVLGVFAYNSSQTWSPAAPGTEIAKVATTAGSSDRGLMFCFKTVEATGAQSIQATAPGSGAVCGVVVALEIG